MDEQKTSQETLQKINEQNKKMRKKLLLALCITVGVVAVLVAVLLIVKACQEDDGAFSLPDDYFYPTYQGDIFEYDDYLDKRPDVILYCEDPDGLGRTTSIDSQERTNLLPRFCFCAILFKL